jgi:hypothetical protein
MCSIPCRSTTFAVPYAGTGVESNRERHDLYGKATILKDFDRAIDLLKLMPTPEERQRATVFMDGLAEMRREFNASPSRGTSARRGGRARKRSGR